MPAAQPHMVRRPLVAEGGGDGRMNLKGLIGEGKAELRERAWPFVAAVRHGDEVGNGQMAFAVGAVGGGGGVRQARARRRGMMMVWNMPTQIGRASCRERVCQYV